MDKDSVWGVERKKNLKKFKKLIFLFISEFVVVVVLIVEIS